MRKGVMAKVVLVSVLYLLFCAVLAYLSALALSAVVLVPVWGIWQLASGGFPDASLLAVWAQAAVPVFFVEMLVVLVRVIRGRKSRNAGTESGAPKE